MRNNSNSKFLTVRSAAVVLVGAACLMGSLFASAQTSKRHGVLVHLNASAVATFQTHHTVQCVRLNANRDLYLCKASDGRSDSALLTEFKTDANASRPLLNAPVTLSNDQSTASVLNDDQSTASVLNDDQSTASVLNDDDQSTASVLNQSTASVLNGNVDYYGTRAPAQYVGQPLVAQIQAGNAAHALATGRGVVVAEIDNGVDQFNPVLRRSLLARRGYNFYDGTPNWSAWADLAQSTASVLNSDQSTASVLNDDQSTASVLNDDQSTASVLNDDQSTASVLNDQSTASVLNGTCLVQSTASVLNGQSTASVLNDDQSTASVLNDDQSTASVLNDEDQSTASVLNDDQSTASVLNALNKILACNPDFGHGTSVAGLIHLIAPEAKILPIKAFGPDGTADASVIYQALTYAMDQHADVINLSFSATDTTPDIMDAIAEAVSKGIVIAAAAGNSNVNTAVYPASLPGVMGVGAVDGTGANPTFPKASFSNFGNTDVDVAAPGVQLFTTYPGFGRIWATVSGTSFTAPLAAGEAALLVQLNQTGTSNRSDIENSSNAAISGNLHNVMGHGMIQVLGALQSVHNAHPGNGNGNNGNSSSQLQQLYGLLSLFFGH